MKKRKDGYYQTQITIEVNGEKKNFSSTLTLNSYYGITGKK